MRQIRSFLAIPLTDEIRDCIRTVRNELAPLLPAVRWSAVENLHITLKFFGNIPEDSLEKIAQVMLSVGSSNRPFPAEIAGFGTFPSPARPRVFWLGIKSEALPALHAELDQSLETIGIPRDERPFSPHLTLGRSRERMKPVQEVVERFRHRSCGRLFVEHIVLYESRLHSTGAEHRPVTTVHLGG